MAMREIRTEFDDEGARFIRKSDGKLLSTGSLHKELYSLNISKDSLKAITVSIGILHELLAHIDVM